MAKPARAPALSGWDEPARGRTRISTRIVFHGSGEVIVTQEEADVVHAIRHDHPNPVTLESATGVLVRVNWDHAAYVKKAAGV